MPGSETALLASPAPVQSAVAAVAGGRKPAALVRRAVLCGSPENVGPSREEEGGREGGKEGWKEKEDKVGEREVRRGKVREREKGRRREEVR